MLTLMNLRVRTRLLCITALAVMGMLLLSVLGLMSERELMLADRMAKVRNQVQTAAGVVEHYRDLSNKG